MDIWTLLRTALRRWYVALPIFVVALAIGFGTAQSLEPTYSATSTAVLTGPQIVYEQGEAVRVNPFLNLGGSLGNTTDVMAALMNSETKRLEHAQRGILPYYEVNRDDALLYFEVSGSDPEAVVFTASELITILDEEVALLQADPPSPAEQRVAARSITVPSQATQDSGGRLQLVVLAAAVGLLLALVAAALVDGISRSRSQRASRTEVPDGQTEETVPTRATAAHVAPAVPADGAAAVTPEETVAAPTETGPPPAETSPATLDEWLDDESVGQSTGGHTRA